MDKIELIKFNDSDNIYKLLHKWCNEKFVYEWFEQRTLSYDEIIKKYKTKFIKDKQKLYIINYNGNSIGLVQIYPYDDIMIDKIKKFKIIYEYDIFIGESNYLSKGIGSKTITLVNKLIYEKYNADCIVLRPFKRNTRAIKCYQKNNFQIIYEYEGKDTLNNNEEYVVLINTKKQLSKTKNSDILK